MKNDTELSIKTNQKDGIFTRYLSNNKLFVYWYTPSIKINVIQRFFKQDVGDQIIRVYDVTTKKTLPKVKSYPHLDIRVPIQQNYWTIKGIKENKSYIFELGVLVDGIYFPIHRSSIVRYDELSSMEEQTSIQMFMTNSRGWNENVSTYSFYEYVERSEKKHDQ
jgi:hypothetical protein